MLKSWTRGITLAIQAKTGFTPALFVWIGIAIAAAVTSFAYFTVAAYGWLSSLFGSVYGGLIVAGFFLVVALIGALLGAAARSRAKHRAMLERAARTPVAISSLLDSETLGLVMQTARTLGWERIVGIALFAILLGQWAWKNRERKSDEKASQSRAAEMRSPRA